MRAFLVLGEIWAVRAVERREYRVFAVGRVPTIEKARGGDAHTPGWLMTIHTSAPVSSERRKEWMSVRVDGSRSIENTERSLGAVERIELRQYPAAARLDPGDFERVLVLRAQSDGHPED